MFKSSIFREGVVEKNIICALLHLNSEHKQEVSEEIKHESVKSTEHEQGLLKLKTF